MSSTRTSPGFGPLRFPPVTRSFCPMNGDSATDRSRVRRVNFRRFIRKLFIETSVLKVSKTCHELDYTKNFVKFVQFVTKVFTQLSRLTSGPRGGNLAR